MKKIAIIFCAAVVFLQHVQAQGGYSQWITASQNSNLKVRYTTTRDSKGYSFLVLEFMSSSNCKFNVTASACSNDPKDKNGWKAVELIKDKPARRLFKILNSCSNGFWWWYKDYRSGAIRFD